MNIKYYIAKSDSVFTSVKDINWGESFSNIEDAMHEADRFWRKNSHIYALVDNNYIYSVEAISRDYNIVFRADKNLNGDVKATYRFNLRSLEKNPSEYYQYAQTTIGDLFTINRLHAVKMENKNEDTSR